MSTAPSGGRAGTAVAGEVTEPSVWADRRFVAFAAGNTVNNLGEGVHTVALPLLVYDHTRSLTLMSLLMAFSPATWLLAPLRGALADRIGPGRLVMPGLTAQLAAALALIVVVLREPVPLWALFCLAAAGQLAGGFYQTGWMTGLATMFPRSPARARGTLGGLFLTTQTGGALVVAVAVPWAGTVGLLWFNAATMLAPMVVWWCGIRPVPLTEAAPHAGPGGDRGWGLAEGWRVLRAAPAVFDLTLIRMPLLFSTALGSLAVFLLQDHWRLPAQDVATLMTVARSGAAVGSLAVSHRRVLRFRRVAAVSVTGAVASILAMSAPVLPLFVTAWAVFTLSSTVLGVVAQMTVYACLPAHALGRANGTVAALTGASVLAGQLCVPLLVALVGPCPAILLLGVTGLLSVARLRRLSSHHAW
ncbi:MFS transporter [Streptomyces beigongshangae]|uniref:MFS transporter n=1 Tax=Streptomyces beigongshangae TaxID=2841597 RepID=UPI001C8617F5|nr:MFS transporter [Streptomyces sp. REN17]